VQVVRIRPLRRLPRGTSGWCLSAAPPRPRLHHDATTCVHVHMGGGVDIFHNGRWGRICSNRGSSQYSTDDLVVHAQGVDMTECTGTATGRYRRLKSGPRHRPGLRCVPPAGGCGPPESPIPLITPHTLMAISSCFYQLSAAVY